ncbi:PREDICTED: nucleoredoxin-like [Papilio polytes]|uniref:nucleoredoxin-like n=1 Tax=Papilio polytes TaxID=76194 RepID=UPI0006762D42|nr:PREDICTED: nucleoredoxin-like [Papilio polytes]
MDWREKLFGKVLVKCDSPGTQNGQFENVPTLEALGDCVEDGEGAVCGIYFSFANISDTSDDFGVRLEDVYKKVDPRLKVVQVVLWAHVGTPEGPVEREAGFRRSLTGKPWFAVPFHDVDIKRRLTQKYSIAVGVPTLVIRGRPVRDALLNDPGGERFPWPAPPLQDVLRGVQLQGEAGSKLFEELPGDTVKVFYFAAHWCPPCRTFAPSLCNALAAVRKRRAKYTNTQLILVSSDRSEQSYKRTVSSVSAAGALAVPWAATEARLALPTALGVAGIPALVLTDSNGKVITANGRQHLAADPLGLNFPWGQRPVSLLTEQALLKMARHPAVVLFIDDEDAEIEFSESVLTPSAESYYEECSIQYPGFCPYQNSSDDETMDFDYTTSRSRVKKKSFKHVMFYIGIDGTDSADMLREHIGLDDAVPLLTAIDFPKQRMVTMKYGDEITTDSVQNFVDAYLSGNSDFKPLKPYSEKC